MDDRTKLLKSLLTFIPLYYFSCIHVPKSMVNRLEREYKAFLWDHSADQRGDQRGLHFVA